MATSTYYLVTFEKRDEKTGIVWDKKLCLTEEQYSKLNDAIEVRPAYISSLVNDVEENGVGVGIGNSVKKVESISYSDFMNLRGYSASSGKHHTDLFDAICDFEERIASEEEEKASAEKDKKMMYCYVIFYLFILYHMVTGKHV